MATKTTLASPPPRDDSALNVDDDELLLSSDHGAGSRASGGSKGAVIDAAVHRFPFCIVWSPIPIITWFLPFIGHMGLADSRGVIFDFAGPYTIGEDAFAFGAATRYLQCTVAPEDVAKWDEAVAAGCKVYEKRMHNLCCDNCHSHVAVCLEHFNYAGRKRWNMVELCFWMFCRGKYVSVAGFVKSWLPFVFVLALIAIVRKKLDLVPPFLDSLSNSPTPAQMLAYTLSRAQQKVAMCQPFIRPIAPPNTPLIVIPDVSLVPEQEQEELEHHDGIDFSRLRAELDRLLEEGLSEEAGAIGEASQETPDKESPDEEAHNHTTNVYNNHQDAERRSATTETMELTLDVGF